MKSKLSLKSFPGGSDGEESACNAGDLGSIPRMGRIPGEGNGYPLQYSCLENSMERGARQSTYCPWDCKEWGKTVPFTFIDTRIAKNINGIKKSMKHTYIRLINVQQRCQNTGPTYMHIQKINLNPNLILSTNIYSRSIRGQNENVKIQKHLKNTGKYLLGANKKFLEMTLRQKHKRKVDALNSSELLTRMAIRKSQ